MTARALGQGLVEIFFPDDPLHLVGGGQAAARLHRSGGSAQVPGLLVVFFVTEDASQQRHGTQLADCIAAASCHSGEEHGWWPAGAAQSAACTAILRHAVPGSSWWSSVRPACFCICELLLVISMSQRISSPHPLQVWSFAGKF